MSHSKTDPVALTADLVRCPSITPEEGGALVLLEERLSAGGFDCTRVDRGGVVSRIWNNEVIATPDLGLADGQWHHVARVFGISTGGQRLYVDGVERVTGAKTVSDFTGDSHMQIGYSLDGTIDYFDGQMDEVRVSHRTRGPNYIWASWYSVCC